MGNPISAYPCPCCGAGSQKLTTMRFTVHEYRIVCSCGYTTTCCPTPMAAQQRWSMLSIRANRARIMRNPQVTSAAPLRRTTTVVAAIAGEVARFLGRVTRQRA